MSSLADSSPVNSTPGAHGRAQVVRDILEWDIETWSAALDFWESHVQICLQGACRAAGDSGARYLPRVLDIGARNGGLSLHWALKGFDVVCSDVGASMERARELHRAYGVEDRVCYEQVDATRIAHADGSFDIVSFKSVLGGIGYGNNYLRQKQALCEMHRVLRPGGLLLFAENLQGSLVHRYFRERFVSWARDWRYPDLSEMADLFSVFSTLETECHGVLATFGRSEKQRTFLARIDKRLEGFLPDRWKYMVAGVAVK